MPRPITLEDQITFRRSTEKISFYEYCKRNGLEPPKKPEPEPIKVTFQKPAPIKIKLPEKPTPAELLKEEFSPPPPEIEPPKITIQEILEEKKVPKLSFNARKVYDYLLRHTITASKMSELLMIPKDYTYKYIKEIRDSIGHDKVLNVDGVYKLVKE